MAEQSFLWSAPAGAGDGASSFTRTDWSSISKVLAACFAPEGVAAMLNTLTGSVTGANTVQINTGGAVVDGKPYYNSSAVSVNIPSAAGGGNTRIDRVVLRADWTAQTVRVTRIAGIDAASPTAPLYATSTGAVYDVPLYQALVNTSGTVTLTDERVLAYSGVGTVGTTAIQALAVTTAKIAANAVTEAKMGALSVGTPELITNSVDDTIAGDRMPQFYRRQGGDSVNWAVPGTSLRIPTSVRMQAGAASTLAGSVTVTFPVAFSSVPIVFVTSTVNNYIVAAVTVTATQVQISADDTLLNGVSTTVNWLAIGPE